MTRRLFNLTSAIALASAAINPLRRIRLDDPPEPSAGVVDVQRFQRCFCTDCVIADASDRFGYWQYRLL